MKKILCSFLLWMSCEQAWARAGGAGGGHSFGGGGGHSFSVSPSYGHVDYYGGSGTSNTSPMALIILFVLILIIYYYYNNSGPSRQESVHIDPEKLHPLPLDLSAIGGDTPEEISKKVATAFLLIQQAWSQKRLDIMRRFISDGVYQRFNAQFTMMNILTQSNPITGVYIQKVNIVKSFQEGGYDCIDVRIQAVATDQFVCEKYPQLSSPGGTESFVEYWSFIRRHDHKKNLDIFHSESCPQCSAPLSGKLVETARCPYCGTYLNSGEYDWVLSEITQENQYGSSFSYSYSLRPMIGTSMPEILHLYPSFSRLVLEDRASNALMQILISSATGNVPMLKRFTTPKAFEELTHLLPPQPVIYERLFTGAVEVLGVRADGNLLRAYVGIQYNAHQMAQSQVSFAASDESPLSYVKVLVLLRELSTITAKGSVFANTCPHCGAPQTDSLSPVCQFCGSSLNDPKLDWIVDGIMDLRQFRAAEQVAV